MANDILYMDNITKVYPGVKALDNVKLKIKRGTIHALVGENGAGKSTLMNVLSGIIPYNEYEGEIYYDGELCKFKNVHDSEEKGIVIVHQELALIPTLSIAENIFIGNEIINKYGIIDWDKTYKLANEFLKRVGLKEDGKTLVSDIPVNKQQLVEIAKAVSKNAKLLILDEPTSSLDENDSKMLLDLIISFKNEGITSIIITHKLNEVAYCADEITVIRDGATIETIDNDAHNIDENYIVKKMVGRDLNDRYPKRIDTVTSDVVFEVKNWNVYSPIDENIKIVDNANFYVKKGETIGFYGLKGAGRTELMMSLFGKSYGSNISGYEYIEGKVVDLKNIKDAIRHGISYVTEDRKGSGLILSESVSFNIILASLDKLINKNGIGINYIKQNWMAEYYVEMLDIKTPNIFQKTGNLSGGNQQKVLLGKWLYTKPSVLILDEPTRGIDIKSKYEIYLAIKDLLKNNKSIIMVSSELPELLGMCDRIYVMNAGRIIAEFTDKEATQELIMSKIVKDNM